MRSTISYHIGRYEIRLNIWLLILFLATQTLLNELGFWQLNRAKEKQQRLEFLAKGNENELANLSHISEKELNQFNRVSLELQPLSSKAIFLDNKTHKKVAGYQVLSLAKDVKSGKSVLVNHGWIFGGKDRLELPKFISPYDSGDTWLLSGRLYPITEELSPALGEMEVINSNFRIPYLDRAMLSSLEKQFGTRLEAFVIRLDADAPHALEVDWKWTNMPVEKHLAYAVQWFGLALALLIICLVVAIKKR
ncbi:SURF1 family protein [Aliikangiella sp. G2MR2-5]|uniref:SURF1 family protein n=1 Tax=Aliikangiella sp. G2MR2-5 TaxID=2788943 RepID=UPI0018A91062|nr:SURF1 family protein [Aliikangiella sp. G2MR2-5]